MTMASPMSLRVPDSNRWRRRSRTALWLVSLVLVASLQSTSVNVVAFSMNRYSDEQQQQLHQPDMLNHAESDDNFYEDYARNSVKRDGSKGSCTCTCETRPVSVSSRTDQQPSAQSQASAPVQSPVRNEPLKSAPEPPSLIRTAARMETARGRTPAPAGATESKTSVAAASKVAESSKVGGSGSSNSQGSRSSVGQIVQVPSMYDVMATEDNNNKQEVDEQSQEPQTNEQWMDNLLNSGQDNWGHGSRYPWKRLPDTMCYREPCQADKDCCLRFNLCDRSAHVCVDCWYGSTCTSERDCCIKYPYCQRDWKTSEDGRKYVAGGKCVSDK
jgi:hypothetical protein